MSTTSNGSPVKTLEHIGLNFILAGKWDFVPSEKCAQYREDRAIIPYAERTNIDKAAKLIEKAHIKGFPDLKWKTYPAAVDEISEDSCNKTIVYQSLIAKKDSPLYGEYQFFSAPIRKIIYNSDLPGSRELSRIFFLDGLSDEGASCEYVVQYYDCELNTLTEYRMPVTNIILRLFGVGVMMLSFHTQQAEVRMLAKEKDQWSLSENVLSLSPEEIFCNCGSIGRRMYQPFINGTCIKNDIVYDRCNGCRICNESSSGLNNCKDSTKYCNACIETAVYSCLLFTKGSNDSVQIPICYNRDAYPKTAENMLVTNTDNTGLLKPEFPTERKNMHNRYAYPNSLCFLEELFDGKTVSWERYEELYPSKKSQKEDKIVVNPFQDDRMYLHGYYADTSADCLATKLKTAYPWRDELLKFNMNSFEQNTLKKWYAVTQMDRNCSASCQDLEMLKQQIERNTYSRWVGWGTIYALTANSFLMVMNDPSEGYLIDNMQWHYFQLFIVALLQRCSTLRFYEEASAIMNQTTATKNVPALCDSLRSQYIVFLNSVWWKEVSLQIQGQEMYRMLSENMEIDDNVKQLDEALSELYEYNEGIYQKKISNVMNLYVVPGLLWAVIELLGFIWKFVTGNDPRFSFVSGFVMDNFVNFGLCVLICGAFTYLLYKLINRRKSFFKTKRR